MAIVYMAKELNRLLDELQAEGRPQIGGVSMREPSLMPPFCRQGNKYIHRKKIIPLIPPHDRYVELFAGSGAIFYNKEKATENILNDLDKGVVKRFNMIKTATPDMDGKIIKKYDDAHTFFFLDPPYENTDKDFQYAEDVGFDFERLADELRGIKGKFLMTINDSPTIRRLFKDFTSQAWGVPTGWGTKGNKGRKHVIRRELLISNYRQRIYN